MSTVFIQSKMDFKQDYDSKEELLFSFYLQELKNTGFIREVEYQPEAFVLTEDLFVHAFEKHKNYNEHKKIKLTQGAVYTADFKITWNKDAHGLFYWTDGGIYDKGFYPFRKAKANAFVPFFARNNQEKQAVSHVDVKGSFSNAHGLAKFSVIQKWLETKGTFINKIVVTLDEKGIFAKTFFPRYVVTSEVYKKNCKHGKEGESKIKTEVKLLEHYLKWRK